MYVSVLTQIGVKAVDQTFFYHVPKLLENNIKIGVRVRIPFGNMILDGFVLGISDNSSYDNSKIKDIINVIDEEPVLNKEMLLLGKYMSDNLLASLSSCYQVMLPKALKAEVKSNIKIKYDRYLHRIKSIEEIDRYIDNCKYESQINLLCKLKEGDILITKMSSSINTIIKYGFASIIYEECKRYKYDGISNYKRVNLTDKQRLVSDTIISSFGKSDTFLLYGVTGSGKTEVYMDVIEKAINNGKSAIMLVPEIGLTPQIVGKFISRFGNVISVLHSKLSDSERYDEYRKITDGEAKIVIGTRSAIFVPFNNIGVIIIDEEHTSSYKQDNNPRYSAINVAEWRSKYHNCPLVLGSATPSLESFAKAGNHVYKLLSLTERAGGSVLPIVNIVDMKEEVKKGNFILSDMLKNKISEVLSKGEQAIILLNRRGYSSTISCKECGYVYKCPNCDITYTYHKSSNNLKCHYCGYSMVLPNKCSICGSDNLKDYGLGTEKLEETLNSLYKAKIVRMDVDTTSKKGQHQKIIDDFEEHKYDILIGTQMIAKGLDFPLVTLVGVVSIDSSLTSPDYRASENTFQLLSQVSGRAGRSENKGEVIVQTFNPDHYAITLAKNHDYIDFYKEEMKVRKMLKYSPYYYMVLVSITSKDYELGFKEANKIGSYIRNNISSDSIVLGPTMANMFKVNNIYHYQIIIKYRKDDSLMKVLKFIIDMQVKNNKIDVSIDFNPSRI
ncbi:MAG: primosomal protein N' [Bacilli bacterium]|nr:primosomal protein N' [Bacilli bacterium]